MRIAIDLSAARTTGPKVYCTGLMPALGRLAQDDEFLVFMSRQVGQLVGAELPDNFQQQITNVTDMVLLRVVWQQIVLPRYLKAWRADVLFAPFDIAPLALSCPLLLAVRNPTPALLANGALVESRVERARAGLLRLLAYLSCRKAHLVLYPSAYASRLLGDMMKVPISKRAVVYHGTDHSLWATVKEPTKTLGKYGLEAQRYVLFVSQLYRQKQPDVLIDGFAIWRSSAAWRSYRLVLAGEAPNRSFGRKLWQQVCDRGIDDATLFLGHVARSDLAILYQQAAAFVLPTVMETFGHPFVEAMASGAPVVCADTEFARELCGEAALFFSAGDAQALAQALNVVVGQPSVSARMREAGRDRAKMFSWDREARETLALMKRVGNDATPG